MRRRRQRKQRKSKYDPYIKQIIEYRESGMNANQIAEELSDTIDADAGGINHFCKARGIQSLVTQGARGERNDKLVPNCNDCSKCYDVLSFNGKDKSRICRKSERMIGKTCATSPMWCSRRVNNG